MSDREYDIQLWLSQWLSELQLDVALRKRDPRWHCGRSFRMPLAGGKAEIFFYDTSPFILSYHNASWAGQLGAQEGCFIYFTSDLVCGMSLPCLSHL